MTAQASPAGMLAEPGLLSRSWRNLASSDAIVIASMCWVLIVIVCALAGSSLAPHSPTAQDLTIGMRMPSGSHWLGTTTLGTDVFSIVIAGTRTAVVGPVLIAIGARRSAKSAAENRERTCIARSIPLSSNRPA